MQGKTGNQSDSDTERCPIGTCDKILGDEHWCANPDSPMIYHTNKEYIARHWEHIGGLTVTPETDPYTEGTVGHSRSVNTDTDRPE